MLQTFLDLRNICNHRMVYPEEQQQNNDIDFGINGNTINEKDIPFDVPIRLNDLACVLRKNAAGYDNAECCSQCLDVDEVETKAITIFGFCSWGYFKENFELIFADGTSGAARAYFSDICYPLTESAKYTIGIDKVNYLDGCKIFYKFRCRDGTGHLYYYRTYLRERKKLKKILFPNNCLMNIFAITIEN